MIISMGPVTGIEMRVRSTEDSVNDLHRDGGTWDLILIHEIPPSLLGPLRLYGLPWYKYSVTRHLDRYSPVLF